MTDCCSWEFYETTVWNNSLDIDENICNSIRFFLVKPYVAKGTTWLANGLSFICLLKIFATHFFRLQLVTKVYLKKQCFHYPKKVFLQIQRTEVRRRFSEIENPWNSLITFVSDCSYISTVHQIFHTKNSVKTCVVSVL